jgi:hypothetical protein
MPIELTSVSGRVFPRSGCVHDHEPTSHICAEKSGLAIATGVGAGAGAAAETSGVALIAITMTALPNATAIQGFISRAFLLAEGTS